MPSRTTTMSMARSPTGLRTPSNRRTGRRFNVVVQREAQPQQQPPLEHPGRHRGVADGAEQDRVVAAQLVQHAVRQRLAGAGERPGAQVVVGALDARQDRVEDLQGDSDDLRADAVAAEDREPGVTRSDRAG